MSCHGHPPLPQRGGRVIDPLDYRHFQMAEDDWKEIMGIEEKIAFSKY